MRRPKSKLKKLQKENENLWKLYCLARDGRNCQVSKYFPTIAIRHTSVFQVDHCFSRGIKELFLDVANGTVVCSSCNSAKGSGKIWASRKDAVTQAVHQIVREREGVDTYNRLLEIASGKRGFTNWSKVWWQEEQGKILREMIEHYQSKYEELAK